MRKVEEHRLVELSLHLQYTQKKLLIAASIAFWSRSNCHPTIPHIPLWRIFLNNR